MSTLATWSYVVQSRDVSPHNCDDLAMSGLGFSVAPSTSLYSNTATTAARLHHTAGMLIAWLAGDCHGGDSVTPTTETLL